MDFLTAVKSGKKFKRPCFGRWLLPIEHNWVIIRWPDGREKGFTIDDIEATDWIVEEKKVEITCEQLERAFFLTLPIPHPGCEPDQWPTYSPKRHIKALAQELGLL